jgi:hypothetical protein
MLKFIKLMDNNEYNPETYPHNCKPVGIRNYPGPGGDEKYYLTEFERTYTPPKDMRVTRSVARITSNC